MDLRPCPGCRRHASIDEAACPFCGHELAPTARPVLPRGRLSRAAVFAGAALAGVAGCGGKKAPTIDPQTAGSGSAAVQADAGTTPDASPVAKPDPDQRNVPMPYGAPPARRRVV